MSDAVITGTSYEGRAEIIRNHCQDGAAIYLSREPYNEYDPNAIAVYIDTPKFLWFGGHKKIGYLKKERAESLAKKMDNGQILNARIKSFYAPPGFESPRVTIEW
jgi:hypothetical protein